MRKSRQSEKVMYLQVYGSLKADNTFSLRPGYLDNRPRPIFEEDSSFRVQQLNDARELLLTTPLPLMWSCALEARRPSDRVSKVRGWVPFSRSTRVVRFVLDDIVVHEFEVSRIRPRIELLHQPVIDRDEHVVLEWRASHDGGYPLQFMCRYSNDGGRRWIGVGERKTESCAEFDLSDFPGGKACCFAVVATDGVNTDTVVSDPFEVREKPPVVIILEPSDGCEILESDHVQFVGQAYIREEYRVEKSDLTWTSSLDGELGRGGLVERQGLSPGTHEITLSSERRGRHGEMRISIECRASSDCASRQLASESRISDSRHLLNELPDDDQNSWSRHRRLPDRKRPSR